MLEYLSLGHAEDVPLTEACKPQSTVYYPPMHVVYKSSSSTTKIRAVFDASAKSSTGISLNDILLIGPTVHSSLVDVLLRFRSYRIGLTADVSKMYRAIRLADEDKDLHRFVWRSDPKEVMRDYRMTRVTFGVSASIFAVNMSVKQNSIDLVHEFPLAAKMVDYVDDGLMGADSIERAIDLRKEVQALFSRGGFLLRKWISNETRVLHSIEPELRESLETMTISESPECAKALGLSWDTKLDCFSLTVSTSPSSNCLTKRMLVSDIAKIFDVLGWLAPVIIKVKILLQRIWEIKLDWDEQAPTSLLSVWTQWKAELPLVSDLSIPRYYFPTFIHYSCMRSVMHLKMPMLLLYIYVLLIKMIVYTFHWSSQSLGCLQYSSSLFLVLNSVEHYYYHNYSIT